MAVTYSRPCILETEEETAHLCSTWGYPELRWKTARNWNFDYFQSWHCLGQSDLAACFCEGGIGIFKGKLICCRIPRLCDVDELSPLKCPLLWIQIRYLELLVTTAKARGKVNLPSTSSSSCLTTEMINMFKMIKMILILVATEIMIKWFQGVAAALVKVVETDSKAKSEEVDN